MDLSVVHEMIQLVTIPSGDLPRFAAAGAVFAIVTILVRYWYSTRASAFFLATVVLVVLSPLVTRILSVDPWYFLAGFHVVLVVGVVSDYGYRMVTGEDTGVAAFRAVTADWIDRLRDRRRTVRRRLEDILDRKTIIAVLVGMPLSEFVKATVVRAFATKPVRWDLAWAHLVLVLFGLAIGIHWDRIKEAAHDAGEQAEEMVNDEE